MLNNRIKQFREYNEVPIDLISDVLGISSKKYSAFEEGTAVPDIDTILTLADFYKVTVNEFYGYSPHLGLHSPDKEDIPPNPVKEKVLKMSELSWDEKQLLLHYRKSADKESFISRLINENTPEDEKTSNK